MKKCANANRYQALRKPHCNGGDPCDACRAKWDATHDAQGHLINRHGHRIDTLGRRLNEDGRPFNDPDLHELAGVWH